MKIEILKVGYLETNCYILIQNESCLIIDPGDEFDKIDNVVNNYSINGILLTHRHFDHIGALKELIDKYNVMVYDRTNLNEKVYKISDFIFEVIYTPGHTKDSITYYFNDEKIMMTGDFLFKNNIGRTDLPTGSNEDMLKSLQIIKKYSKDIKIYPGHGDPTTLNKEITNNYYLFSC